MMSTVLSLSARNVEGCSAWNGGGLVCRELSLSEPNLHELGEGSGRIAEL